MSIYIGNKMVASSGSSGNEPQIVQVNGFGEIYDNNPWLKDLPKGSIVPFATTSHGGASDMGPWGNFANSITGYIIITLGPEGDTDRGAYICGFLDTSTQYVSNAESGCYAYAYIESTDGGETGGVFSESDWFRVGDLPIAEFTTNSAISINGSIKVGDVIKMRLLIESEDATNTYVSVLGTVEASFKVNAVGTSPRNAVVLGVLCVNSPNSSNRDFVQRHINAIWTTNSVNGTTSLTIDTTELEGYAYVSSDYIYLEQH